MANVAALRKRAADFEQKKQLDKAIATYREILDVFDAGDEDYVDVGLYNRVGDLLVRQGNTPDAVTLYERAVDLYAEGGFFNNAIALCNKILRTSPGRATVYYKLGKISAAKGFNGDAKSNFLEYADRMQKVGKMEEAFRALKEFADLCPDQDDIRLMLAEQLTKANRKGEALEQLQLLHARYDAAGRAAEAQATFERMKALDPNAEVKSGDTGKRAKSDDLVFIDLDAPTPRAGRLTRGISTKIDVAPPPVARPAPQPPPVEHITPVEPAPISSTILGLESTSLGDAAIVVEPAPLPASEFATIDLSAIREAPSGPQPSPSNLALPGDLPLISLDRTPVKGLAQVTTDPSQAEPLPGADALAELDVARDLPLLVFDESPPEVASADPEAYPEQVDLEPATLVGPAGPEGVAAVEPAEAGLGEPVASVLAEAVAPVEVVEPEAAAPVEVLEPEAAAPAEELETDPAASVDPVDADDTASVGYTAGMPETPTSFAEIPDERIDDPPPPVRRTGSVLADSVGLLRSQVEEEPLNWALHRQFAEALLDDGDREAGIKQLEQALVGFEKANDLEAARSIADEIIRLKPGSVRYHQKRVEYAFRSNDRPRLAEAYVELADALFRDGQAEKAKQVYQRVLELAPDDARALAALESFGTPPTAIDAAAAAPPSAGAARAAAPTHGGRRYTGELDHTPPPPVVGGNGTPGGLDNDYVSLGDWLRDQEGPKSTRMVVDEEAPTGDEAADFADMLRKFKQGVADNVDAEDHEAHYDLGVAYKEMGLVDEAISEFQKALRGHQHRVRTYEALGHCFLEKKQLRVAATILQRALGEPGAREEQLVGVLYLLGYVHESLGKPAEAKEYYERVFGMDIQFRDVGDRLNAIDRALGA